MQAVQIGLHEATKGNTDVIGQWLMKERSAMLGFSNQQHVISLCVKEAKWPVLENTVLAKLGEPDSRRSLLLRISLEH